MTRTGLSRLAAAGLLASLSLCAPASAAEIVRVPIHHLDMNPTTPARAKQVLARIGDAALDACGAPSFSLSEVKSATRASPCWHDAVSDAVRKIDNPLLTRTFATVARR